MFGTRNTKLNRGYFKPALLISILLLSVAWLMAGCTSDDPSEVGHGLVDSEIDVILEPLNLEDIELFTDKNISNEEVSLLDQEVLYFGNQGGNMSSILLNFDFSDIFTEEFPEDIWTNAGIDRIELRLVRLKNYGGVLPGEVQGDDQVVIEKYYELFALDAPFDAANYPGEEPDYGFTDLNEDDGSGSNNVAAEPRLEIRKAHFVSWVEEAQVQGLIISEGDLSTEGLIGFASLEFDHANELEDIHEDPGAFPIIVVDFVGLETSAILTPTGDISTFHQLSTAPTNAADGMMVRTCIRTSPILRFDLSTLPDNVFINRAVLSLTNNISTSFGQLEAIVVSEISVDEIGVAGDTITLADLDPATYSVTGMASLDPVYNDHLDFVVTTAIQRIVNDVYEGDRAFILTAGEDIFPVYNFTSVTPDFYFNQFEFYGTAAADSLKPKLTITYSSIDDLTGGGK